MGKAAWVNNAFGMLDLAHGVKNRVYQYSFGIVIPFEMGILLVIRSFEVGVGSTTFLPCSNNARAILPRYCTNTMTGYYL